MKVFLSTFMLPLALLLSSLSVISCWNASSSKKYSGSTFTVTDRYLPVPLDYSASSGSTLNLYVRRFARGSPKKHVLLITGGPGQSARPYESYVRSFEGSGYDNLALYAVDHRGTGKSGKLSKGNQYATKPSTCPNANLLKYYTAMNAARDLISVAETLKNEQADAQVFAISSSYGTYILYNAVRMRPELFTGIILNDFVPSYQVPPAEMTSVWIDLCQEDANCRARFPSVESAHNLMKDLSNPSFNQCTRHLRNLEGFWKYGDSYNLGPLVQAFFGFTLDALDLDVETSKVKQPLLVALAFLYQMHKCEDLEKFKSMTSSLYQDFKRAGVITTVSTQTSLPASASRLAISGNSDGEIIENRFLGGPGHMNSLINNYINYCEMREGDYGKCKSDSQYHLHSDCISNARYIEQRSDYASLAYKAEKNGIHSFSSNTRVISVGGLADNRTPITAAKEAHQNISTSDKHFVEVKHASHGSLYTTSCVDAVHKYLLTGKAKSEMESCIERTNTSRSYDWTDYPGYTQYLWPMDQKEDLKPTGKTSGGYTKTIIIAIIALLLIAAAVGAFFYFRSRRQ